MASSMKRSLPLCFQAASVIRLKMSSILQQAEKRARDNIQNDVKMEQDMWDQGNCFSYILYENFTGIL